MTIEQKGKMIAAIIAHLKFEYRNKLNHESFEKKVDIKPFDEGDTFFSLAFKTDTELLKIARLAGI